MRQTIGPREILGEKISKDNKRANHKNYSSEEKVWTALDFLRWEDIIAELSRRECIAQSLCYTCPSTRSV